MKRLTVEQLYDRVLALIVPQLPLEADGPVAHAGTIAGVDYWAKVGKWSPHDDVRVVATLWPGDHGPAVRLSAWVEQWSYGGIGWAAYEPGVFHMPAKCRGRVEELVRNECPPPWGQKEGKLYD